MRSERNRRTKLGKSGLTGPGSRENVGYSMSTIQTGKLAVDLNTRVATIDDEPLNLTAKEYGILELLSVRKGTILTTEMFFADNGTSPPLRAAWLRLKQIDLILDKGQFR